MIKDLRDWIAAVEARGDLRRVEGAHWDLEVGGLTELNNSRRRPPALLFDRIADYPAGHRVLTSSVVTPSRLGLTLRLGADVTDRELVQRARAKPAEWAAAAKGFDPRVVADSPVRAHIRRGPEVDLTSLPAPRWHEHDGGRYLGTACLVLTRDPETGWVNGGSYRTMIAGPAALTVFILPGKHGRMHLERWWAMGRPAPIAISLGHDPLLAVLAGIEIPHEISELNYAGAVMGEPLEVFEGDVTGLPLPAAAEAVVEGFCHPGDVRPEGPFGEYLGYFSGGKHPQPVLTVEALYHREDPILLGAKMSRPPNDISYFSAVIRSALAFNQLEAAGVPGVTGVWNHPLGGARKFLVVAITQLYPGHARQAAVVAGQCRAAAQAGRFVIVVDDDIDPTDLEAVMWAVVTRADPERDIEIIRRAWGSQADPLHATFDSPVPFNTRALIDATRPYEHRDVFPPVAELSPELRARLHARFAALLTD